MNPKFLGIITARGGSKGLPGKNIKPLLGKPLIAYTIQAARDSGVFDRLILSTDDEKIAAVGREYGCEVPFLRPKELAEDKTPHLPVLQHAVSFLKEKEGYSPDYVMTLQPTSPLRQAFHMREAAELILKTGADSVLSVAEIPENFSPHKAMIKDESGFLNLFNGNPVRRRTARRQDLSPAYWSSGLIYLFRTHLLFHPEEPNCYGEKVAPYIIDKKYLGDINTADDLIFVEKALLSLKNSPQT